MNLGRGFKYLLQTTTRFPDTNLDLYSPRKLSTTEFIGDIIVGHSFRSLDKDGNNSPILTSSHFELEYDCSQKIESGNSQER